MERRVFTAIVLSFAVLYIYQSLFVPATPAPVATPPQQTAGSLAEAPTALPGASASTTPSATAQAPLPITTEGKRREIVVETVTVQAVLTNEGGRIVRWRLKDYRDTDGRPVDLVPTNVPAEHPTPFSLRVGDPEITERLNHAIYRVSGDVNGRVDATMGTATIVFEFQDASGLRVRKELRFDPRNYVVTFSADVTDGQRPLNPYVTWGPGLGDSGATSGGGSFFTGNYVQAPQAIYHRDGKVERITLSTLASEPAHEGQFRFAGIDDHYFIAGAINPAQARLEYQPVTLPGPDGTERRLLATSIRLSQPPQNVRFFFGPKQFDLLKSVDAELVRAINFGMFAPLVVPLLNTLKWLYGFIGNYGWAIVILTILINLAMFPLRHKTVVSMRKLQAIQPQIKVIQDRYANLKVTDPARQKMNSEVMSLYRERGVNPASGCLPMLLTLPVLLAFYSLLSQSIELRGAGFAGWITDLSAADPYYVLPALMGVSTFWQQKISPTTVDPAQQRIMMMMPVMFTAMMVFSPSGVVLYWFVGNVWAIGQQYFTNWLIGPSPVIAARPPAERRLKNGGTGRTPGAEQKN